MQRGSKKGIKKRGQKERKERKRSATAAKPGAGTKTTERSSSRGVKRQKSKSVTRKRSLEKQETVSPQRKRPRQKSIAYDDDDENGDVEEQNA